jgi:DNA-binding transcriptional MerR regulator
MGFRFFVAGAAFLNHCAGKRCNHDNGYNPCKRNNFLSHTIDFKLHLQSYTMEYRQRFSVELNFFLYVMLIGELSKKSGLTRDTIRFYEKQGLIDEAKKLRPFNNYKEYTEETLNRLLTIKKVKSFGFTLNESAELLEMVEMQTATCDNVASRVADKVELIDEKIRELEELKALMIRRVQECRTCCAPQRLDENCPILLTEQ